MLASFPANLIQSKFCDTGLIERENNLYHFSFCGYVKTLSGKPVANASVHAFIKYPYSYHTRTDSSGFYYLEVEIPGYYIFRVSAKGYTTKVRGVLTGEPNTTKWVNFTLYKIPNSSKAHEIQQEHKIFRSKLFNDKNTATQILNQVMPYLS